MLAINSSQLTVGSPKRICDYDEFCVFAKEQDVIDIQCFIVQELEHSFPCKGLIGKVLL